MAKTTNISGLINRSGCLNQNAIIAFIEGSLDANNKQIVLNHLRDCPLCQDAVEGAANVTPEKYLKDSRQLLSLIKSQPTGKSRKNRLRYISYAAAAASVLIIIGVFLLYRQFQFVEKDVIAVIPMSDEKVTEKVVTSEEYAPQNEAARPVALKKKESISPQSKTITEAYIPEIIEFEDAQPEEEQKSNNTPADFTAENQPVTSIASGAPAKQQDESEYTEKILTENAPVNERSRKSAFNVKVADKESLTRKKTETSGIVSFTLVSEMPSFMGGGQEKFTALIQDSLNSNKTLLQAGFRGDVIASFVVDTTGKLKNVKILNIQDLKLQQEISNVFKVSPEWTPGKQNGVKVKVEYTVSIEVNPQKY